MVFRIIAIWQVGANSRHDETSGGPGNKPVVSYRPVGVGLTYQLKGKTDMKTTSKKIDAGQKHDSEGKLIAEWPAGQITMQSVADVWPDLPAFIVKAADDQLKQHQASSLWRSSGGDLSEAGSCFLGTDSDGVLLIDKNHIPGQRSTFDPKELAATVKSLVPDTFPTFEAVLATFKTPKAHRDAVLKLLNK